MALIKNKYRVEVDANTEDYDSVTPADGVVWEISSFAGSASGLDTHVALIWDYLGGSEEILALAHTSDKHRVDEQITGDGTKKLALVLRNDTADAERLSAEYYYKVIP
jgi:hypothetical protein